MGRLLLLWQLQPTLGENQTLSIRESAHLLAAQASPSAKGISIGEVSVWGLGVIQDSNYSSLDSDCESRRKKMIGKPCVRKLHARFDEGELEIEPRLLRQFPALPSSSQTLLTADIATAQTALYNNSS